MLKAWAIKKWNEVFESATSRKLQRLDYVCIPTNHDSERYEHLMETMAGAAAFGHFRAMVDYAATLPCRGLFVRSGAAMTIDQIARRIFVPTNHLRRSWSILVAPDVGWLIEAEVDPSALTGSFVYLTGGNLPAAREKSASDPPQAREKSAGGAGEISQGGGPPRVNPPTQEPNPPTQDPPTPRRGEPAGFEAFWRDWPKHERKANRKGCLRAWKAAGLDALAGEVLASLARWKISRAWCKNDGEFIPAPMVWLNQERWKVTDIPEASEGERPVVPCAIPEAVAREMLGLPVEAQP